MLWQSLHGHKAIFPPFVADEKSRLAKKLGPYGLSEILEQIALTEYSVKSGNLQPIQAMDMFISKMLRNFKPGLLTSGSNCPISVKAYL